LGFRSITNNAGEVDKNGYPLQRGGLLEQQLRALELGEAVGDLELI
jgi:hypothetical protein